MGASVTSDTDTAPDSPNALLGSLHPQVRSVFPSWNVQFEGRCRFLYTDKYGLVTCGDGYLCDFGSRRTHAGDPMGSADAAPALALGWSNPDGGDASAQQIRSAWWAVKTDWPSTQSVECARLTMIRLTDEQCDALTIRKLEANWVQLARRWPAIGSWPATAQLAVCSMSWAMGPAFAFPRFELYATRQDWLGCMAECRISDLPTGRGTRNDGNRNLFSGAAAGLTIESSLS